MTVKFLKKSRKIVEKTPDLKELHTDGGYGSEAVEQWIEKMEENDINLVTTAVRGRESKIKKLNNFSNIGVIRA